MRAERSNRVTAVSRVTMLLLYALMALAAATSVDTAAQSQAPVDRKSGWRRAARRGRRRGRLL